MSFSVPVEMVAFGDCVVLALSPIQMVVFALYGFNFTLAAGFFDGAVATLVGLFSNLLMYSLIDDCF